MPTGRLFVNGAIKATAGGNIGGFQVSTVANGGTSSQGAHCYATTLYAHTTDGTKEYETGIRGSSGSGASGYSAFYVKEIDAGDPWSNSSFNFYVLNNGKLFANNAEITGKITATTGKIGGWDIDATGLAYTSNNVTTEVYPSYIYLAEFVAGQAPQIKASANLDASGVMVNKNDGSMLNAIPGEVKVTSASMAKNVSLKATSSYGGVYDENLGKWIIRTSNVGVAVPDVFRSAGQDDATIFRYPVQSSISDLIRMSEDGTEMVRLSLIPCQSA